MERGIEKGRIQKEMSGQQHSERYQYWERDIDREKRQTVRRRSEADKGRERVHRSG